MSANTGTIIIVENDPFVRSFIAAVILHATSHRPLLFSRASDALAYIKGHTPDLLILDDHLPDMAGMAFYDSVQALVGQNDLPALVISAQPSFGELARRELTYLVKPFHSSELLIMIKMLLEEAAPSRSKRSVECFPAHLVGTASPFM